jgi:proteic killer suppression protein
MEIFFRTRKLQRILCSESALVREYGEANARLIMRRLVILDAAECLADVPQAPPDRCHALSGRREGQFAVDAKHPQRIIFRPADEPLPMTEDGSLDLSRVTSIEILDVKDYH